MKRKHPAPGLTEQIKKGERAEQDRQEVENWLQVSLRDVDAQETRGPDDGCESKCHNRAGNSERTGREGHVPGSSCPPPSSCSVFLTHDAAKRSEREGASC
jgi:hypothetical protein